MAETTPDAIKFEQAAVIRVRLSIFACTIHLEPRMNINRNVFIGLGANIGDKKQNLATALQYLEQRIGPAQVVSSVYETAPWGETQQPSFYNQVVRLSTNLDPFQVLTQLLEIEKSIGRERREKWKERLIDLDLLFFDDYIIRTEMLTLPHPFLHLRNFVLAPLAEIAPDFVHPVLKETIQLIHLSGPDQLGVKKI